uniref:Uncharacterized protein n=2 Tax=Rhinopithecus TaxID=542827 RepID=A0A2K6KIB6_RHIBE
MTGLCYFYLNFYISQVVFVFIIRGAEPGAVFILRWPIWGCGIFIQVINVLASVKTASMSKQRKLPTYWFVLVGNKRDRLVPVTGVVIVDTSRFGAFTRLRQKQISH